MAYRDMLVHLDASEACAKRIDAAVALAAQHGAHRIGLYPVVGTLPPSFWAEVPPEFRAQLEHRAKVQADAVLTAFREAAEGGGVAWETRTEQVIDRSIAAILSMNARYADLLVMGQADPRAAGSDLAEDVVLSSGRPVLMVPYIGAEATIGRRIVLAWDGSREAARAVSDAMPLLEQAASVAVVCVDPRPAALGALPGADIGQHLARHEVKVEVQRVASGGLDVANVLLSHIADLQADLLVMGAYAHARPRTDPRWGHPDRAAEHDRAGADGALTGRSARRP